MRITFKYLMLLLLVIATSCNDQVIEDGKDTPDPKTAKNIKLSINVPKNSISTYSAEPGTVDENHIDTLFVKILENGTPIDTAKFYGTTLQTVGGSNDSIVNVAFELDNLTGGVVSAEVFANRMEIKPITAEIPLPDKNNELTWFMMSGEGTLAYNGTAYSGTIHVARNVAKLRVRISKHPACIPANLIINYADIQIQPQQVPDRTQLMTPPPISTPAGLTYINYAARTGAALRPQTPIASFTGGQIDSLYLNENFLNNSAYNDANKTQIKITLPSQEPGMPVKTAEYTYQLYAEGGFQMKRNYIYILDIKVAGQSLEPLITLEILPWNDIRVSGDINGVNLNLDRSVVEMNPVHTEANPAIVNYKTDNTSVTLDWSRINPDHNIDTTVSYIQGTDGNIGIFWTGNGAPDYSFKDTLYVISGNVIKAVELVYNIPSGNFGNWIGTFHRWNQTGERIIKIRNTGEWTATVTQGASFIVLDAGNTTDTNWGTASAALGNDAGFDTNFPVNSTATSLTGNGVIFFRVGMKSTLAYVGAPPRYGLIEITTDQGTKRIYVRQGEEADYVMRPQDPNPANAATSRPYAVKFAPFNLADPSRGTGGNNVSLHNDMPYGEAAFDDSKFTEYPSQAGYFFQWNLGAGTIHKAFNPVNTITAVTGWNNTAKPAWERTVEPCPAGYRHPNDSLQSVGTSEIRQSWYETPDNDTYATHQTAIPMDNSIWGFYADGFFDRLRLVASPNNVDSTTVRFMASDPGNATNTGVAYAGRLVYNPTTYASLFLPAPGLREVASNGALTNAGAYGAYWTNTYNGNYGWAFYFNPTAVYSYSQATQGNAISVRCVKDGFGLPGSM